MKFSCEKAILQNAVNIVGRVTAAKSTIPALEGILVEASANDVRLSGYNLDTGIITTVEADVAETGDVVLSAQLFGNILRQMPDDMVTITCDGSFNVRIACGDTVYDILGTNAEDYPDLPNVTDGRSFTIAQKTLKVMIPQVIFCVASLETRPIQSGALFEAEGDQLTMVAVDGFRLALRKEKLAETIEAAPFNFVVPGNALNEVEKICYDVDDPVVITLGNSHCTFQVGNASLVARRLEGEFLDYRKTLPKASAVSVTATCEDLNRSINRTSLIINERMKSPIRCRFGSDGSLTMTSRTALGTALDVCPIDGDGKDLEIGFNNKYLQDAIKACPAEKVRIELTSSTAPCMMLPVSGDPDNFIYMVLPVRLRAGE